MSHEIVLEPNSGPHVIPGGSYVVVKRSHDLVIHHAGHVRVVSRDDDVVVQVEGISAVVTLTAGSQFESCMGKVERQANQPSPEHLKRSIEALLAHRGRAG